LAPVNRKRRGDKDGPHKQATGPDAAVCALTFRFGGV
jgi:hypothetical protein